MLRFLFSFMWFSVAHAQVEIQRVPATVEPDDSQLFSRVEMSADGRWLVFDSPSTNLVAGDTNDFIDVFLYDSQTRLLKRISVAADGSQADDDSFGPDISADGRWVVFHSRASNLVTGDGNGRNDVFLYDNLNDTLSRISVAFNGQDADGNSSTASISADGQWVVYHSRATNLVQNDTNGFSDIFLYHRTTGTTVLLSVSFDDLPANGPSYTPAISADGRWVVFESDAGNLVSDDTNGVRDIFVLDTMTSTRSRVSLAEDGTEAALPSRDADISADGLRVLFNSDAPLVAADVNGWADVYVYDFLTGQMRQVSVGAGGTQANAASTVGSISGDGNLVVFQSQADNLVPADGNQTWDAFEHDLRTGITRRVSLTATGVEANGASNGVWPPQLSYNGGRLVFVSLADNLVPGDNNLTHDIFLVDRYLFRDSLEGP